MILKNSNHALNGGIVIKDSVPAQNYPVTSDGRSVPLLHNQHSIRQTYLRTASSASLYAAVAVLFAALLVCCAGRRTSTVSRQQAPVLQQDTISLFKAVGDVDGSYKGEKFRGKIAVVYDAETGFSCDIYSAFAHTIASISSDDDSADISIGSEEYRIGVNDSISFLPFFNTFPFIFNDLVRIITGRVIEKECVLRRLDAAGASLEENIFTFLCDSVDISCTVSQKRGKIKMIEYKAMSGIPWTLTYTSFKYGISRKVYFNRGVKDNFSLKYEEIMR